MAAKIPPAAGGGAMLVSPAAWEALRKALAEIDIRPDPQDFEISRRGGQLFFRLKPREIPQQNGGGGGGGPCPFGEIVTWTEGEGESAVTKTGIRGGFTAAGDQNWNVPNKEIDLDSDSEDLFWLQVGVTANCSDDGSVTLSGLATSTEPVWGNGAVSGGYPSNTIPAMFPTGSPGAGVIYLPVGVVIVSDGSATIDPTGCGSFNVGHCPGILYFGRA